MRGHFMVYTLRLVQQGNLRQVDAQRSTGV